MSLITCPECQKEISNQASNCPNCGYCLNAPAPEQRKKTKRAIIAIVGAILAIGVIITIYDVCTISFEEASERLKKTSQELQETRDRIADLDRKIAITDILIDFYD